jgi:hypothetical protein
MAEILTCGTGIYASVLPEDVLESYAGAGGHA